MDHAKRGRLVAAEKKALAALTGAMDIHIAGGKVPKAHMDKLIEEHGEASEALFDFDHPWPPPDDVEGDAQG